VTELSSLLVGGKAGALTGLAIGGFFLPSLVFLEAVIWHSGVLVRVIPVIAYLAIGVATIAVISIMVTALVLSALGAAFALVEGWIPGETTLTKALVFYLLLWLSLYGVFVATNIGRFPDFRILCFTLLWDLLFATTFAKFFRKYRDRRTTLCPSS